MASPAVPPLDLSDSASPGPVAKMPAGLQKRASSAPKREKPPPPPITPRNKKASRSLFRELEGTVMTMRHAKKRTEDVHIICVGVMKELAAAVASSEKTLANNKNLVRGTKDTIPGEMGRKPPPKSKGSPVDVALRPLTEDEMTIVRREMRDKIEANGEERDPTEDEIDEAVGAIHEAKKQTAEAYQRRKGSCSKWHALPHHTALGDTWHALPTIPPLVTRGMPLLTIPPLVTRGR